MRRYVNIVICLLLGISMVLDWISDTRLARRAARWPTASGHVESLEGRSRARYRFTVEGTEYEGNACLLPATPRTREKAAGSPRIPGTTVEVCFNPSNPADAILKTDAARPGSGSLLFGLGLLVLGGCGVYTIFRSRTSSSNPQGRGFAQVR